MTSLAYSLSDESYNMGLDRSGVSLGCSFLPFSSFALSYSSPFSDSYGELLSYGSVSSNFLFRKNYCPSPERQLKLSFLFLSGLGALLIGEIEAFTLSVYFGLSLCLAFF